MNPEKTRLARARDRHANWKRWGPYVSDRAWGTVREDYSPHGTAWEHLPHDHARSHAYRWNEDGIAGVSDRHQILCFALALWNHRDPILKERFFGLTGNEGNHGEDVKEHYYYLDSTPTHSYMRMLYKYPQRAFPYGDLVAESRKRTREEPEYELLDTGIFDDDRYFDVVVEYAKVDVEDILVRLTITNRGPEAAALVVLPTLWYRNTWSWDAGSERPDIRGLDQPGEARFRHADEGTGHFHCDGSPELLFTENDTNHERLHGSRNATPYVKDGIDDAVIHGRADRVNPARVGTKCAARYDLHLEPGQSQVLRLRIRKGVARLHRPFGDFDAAFAQRQREADAFYAEIIPSQLSADARAVMRQAFAGMLWSKQFYHYVVNDWLTGDPAQPPPPETRRSGRNAGWNHVYNADVISMPDKWEYPWYAAWDLAFHCIPLALVDSDFAKEQLILLLREWYMHPNGQMPAYEWALSDVNPPVHAWAALRVYHIEKKRTGRGDTKFLARDLAQGRKSIEI